MWGKGTRPDPLLLEHEKGSVSACPETEKEAANDAHDAGLPGPAGSNDAHDARRAGPTGHQ